MTQNISLPSVVLPSGGPLLVDPTLEVDFLGRKLDKGGSAIASGSVITNETQARDAYLAGWPRIVWKTFAPTPTPDVQPRIARWQPGGKGTPLYGLENIERVHPKPRHEIYPGIRRIRAEFPNRALGISIMALERPDWLVLAKEAEDLGADWIELNFGCPNGVGKMGMLMGQLPEKVGEVTSWVVDVVKIPVASKMTPNAEKIIEAADAAWGAGALIVSLINTKRWLMGVDLEAMVPQPNVRGKSVRGGGSGQMIRGMALEMAAGVCELRDRKYKGKGKLIDAMGGIASGYNLAEFLALGVDWCQIFTDVYDRGVEVIDEYSAWLLEFMKRKGYRTIADFRGLALPNLGEYEEVSDNYWDQD